jgi:hypothetical protein
MATQIKKLDDLRLSVIEDKIRNYDKCVRNAPENWLLKYYEHRKREHILYWERITGEKYQGEKIE